MALARIGETLREIDEQADARGISTAAAADVLAEERLTALAASPDHGATSDVAASAQPPPCRLAPYIARSAAATNASAASIGSSTTA